MSLFTDLLADFSSEKRFLVQLEPYNPGTSAVVSLYFSSHGFVSEPSDTPSNQYYAPRLQNAYTFQRSIFQSGKLSGRSIPGNGTLILSNPDSGLDVLATYAWGGRRVRVWLGGMDFALADFGLLFDGTAESIAFGDTDVTVNLRDLAHLADREVQSLTFAGTGGNEGGIDVKDKRKPIAIGLVRNIAPVYLGSDTGKHKFSVNGGPIVGVAIVYDRGAPLAYAASPTAGQYSLDLEAGTLTLGGAFNGPLTCDVLGRRYLAVASTTSTTIGLGSKTFTITAGERLAVGMNVRIARLADRTSFWMDAVITAYSGTSLTVNSIDSRGTGTFTDWSISPWGTIAGIQRSLAAGMGITLFDDASLNALDALQPGTAGYWVPEGGNGLTTLDAIADGSGSYWGFDRSSAFECGRIEAPGTPVASYDSTQIIEIKRLATEDPNHRFTINYRRNWNPLNKDQLAGVAAGQEAYFTTEWRAEKADNTAVLTAYPLSKPAVMDSVLDLQAGAATEAARQLALFGVRRDYFSVKLKVQPLGLETGNTISITHNRYGLDAGKALRVVDITEDMDDFTVELGGWG